MDVANIYQRIKDIFGKLPEDFTIQEDQIDIEVQMEYFEFARKFKKGSKSEEILAQRENLFTDTLTTEEKKILIIQLAGLDSVEAFRTLEKYQSVSEPSLKDWTRLAYQESKLLLESSFLEQSKVFISTGLGGKGLKLRYFVLISAKEKTEINETQKNIIQLEFESILQCNNAEIEKVEYGDYFFTVVVLVPINISVKNIFQLSIDECNQYGNFLSDNFIISNIKIWSIQEIKEFMDEQKTSEENVMLKDF